MATHPQQGIPQSSPPEVRPLKSPPSLFTLNGCGVGMYGKRDFDAATGTYTKTRCLCLVFFPIFALDAYRVADASSRSWYFLGKTDISRFARIWRYGVFGMMALVFAAGGWNSYRESPGYVSKKAREKAASLVAAGHPIEALDVYRGIMRDGIGSESEWRKSMSDLIRSEIASGDARRVVAAVRYADEKKTMPGGTAALVPELADLALEAASKCGDPADSTAILSSFQPTPTELSRVHEALRKSLESLHLLRPDDQETRIKLALIREEFGEVDHALELLHPAAAELGDGEGARLYGHLLLNDGQPQKAMSHLERYTTSRVMAWNKASESLQRIFETAQKHALDELNRTGGPSGFRSRYEAASESEQNRMVDDYLSGEVRKDHGLQAARDRYEAASGVVPAIMDLGVARLRVAQAESEPAARKSLLKKAEEAFLSLKGVAGESDEYRLFLGQIYFWSDREAEGRVLFDQLLDSKKRDAATLFSIANTFRDLGEVTDARKLLEEAFPKATNDYERSEIVSLRSLLASNNDEKVEWLSKGPKGNPFIDVRLAEARAEKAESEGNLESAKRYLHEAVDAYAKQERSTATLNNAALDYVSLYRLEGRLADFETAARLQSEAVALNPADSILSFNAADFQLNAAVLRIVGDRVDPRIAQIEPGISLFRYLYENEAQREPLLASLRTDPSFRKAIAHFWDAALLAPKNKDIYGWGLMLFNYTNDLESLSKLAGKVEGQDFDLTEGKAAFDRFISKTDDGKLIGQLKAMHDRLKTHMSGIVDPKARALALGNYVANDLAGYPFGLNSGSAEWLGDLRAAAKDQPCSKIRTTLDAALEIIALEALEKDDPECARIIEADRRLIGSPDLLRLLVRSSGDLGQRVRKHPAVIAAREAASVTPELFPSSFGTGDWLFLEGLHPEADAKLKALLTANPTENLTVKIQQKLQFEGPGRWMSEFWVKYIQGDVAAAKAFLAKLECSGVKLPPMF